MSDSKKRSEEAAERALREGFKVNVVSAEALQRIRQATEKEWRETTRPAGRRRSRVFAVAASILGVTAAAAWMFRRWARQLIPGPFSAKSRSSSRLASST